MKEQSTTPDIPVTILRVPLLPGRSWRLDPYSGVAVRGALGLAFRRLHCQEQQRDCAGCPILRSCPVSIWFDPGLGGLNRPRPFALRLEGGPRVGPNKPFFLVLTLFGQVPHPAALLEAVHLAARAGLGRARIPHHAGPAMLTGQQTAFCEPGRVADWPAPAPLPVHLSVPSRPSRVRLSLLTPLRLPRWLSGLRSPGFQELCKASIYRVRALQRFADCGAAGRWPEPDGSVRLVLGQSRWRCRSRYSARQDRRVKLDGMVGRLLFEGEISPWVDLFCAVELLQLGRATSAGLGVLKLEWS